MRIVQISDSHIYAEPGKRLGGIDTRASFTAVLEAAVAGGAADLLMLTGDNSMDGSAASYKWLARKLHEVDLPMAVLAGNHDEPDEWGALSDSVCQTPQVLRSADGWCVIGLTTRVTDQAYGQLSLRELQAFDSLLATQTADHVLVAMHHPPVAVGSEWIDRIGLRTQEKFWSVIERYPNVRAVMCGHVHQNVDRYVGSVRVLATPSSCAQFEPRAKQFSFDRRRPGFRVFELSADGRIETAVIRVAGDAPRY